MPKPIARTPRRSNSAVHAYPDLKLLDRFADEQVIRRVLPNGLTLLIKPDSRAPIASVQVWVKTGSIHESTDLGAGLSHYLEHMLFKGTRAPRPRSARQISEQVQTHGGTINAYTTFDRTVYYIDLPGEHAPLALDILSGMVLRPSLDKTEAEKERDVILREIAMGEDDPDQRLAQALFSTAFRQHPYAHPIIGHRELFAAVTHERLLHYYRTRYVPANMVVIVAGDVVPGEIESLVAQHFGTAAPQPLAPVYVPAEPPQLAPRHWEEYADVELTRAGIAWAIPGLAHADTPALNLLALLLGGGDSSILWQSIREKKGLVHSIDTTSWNPGSNGLFYIAYTCDAAKREPAIAAILAELERVKRKPPSPAQLRKAIRQLVVGEINTRKTVSGQASRLGAAEVVVGDLAFSQSYFARLAALRPADIQQAAARYLVAQSSSTVSLNPKSARADEASAGLAAAPKRAQKSRAKSAVANAAPQPFQSLTLSNGARLLLRPDHSLPNVHLRLCGLGGGLYEPADRRGATSLLATLLTKDTQRNTAAQVAQRIEEVGGSFYPMSGNNAFGLALEVLPGDLPLAHQLLADAILRPAFLQSTLKQERAAQIAALQDDNDNPVSFGLRQLRRHFFGAHPLAIGPNGEEHALARITTHDLAELHARLTSPANLVFVATGDFEPRAMEKAARKLLGQIPDGSTAPAAPPFTGPSKAAAFKETQPQAQAVVFEAYPAPSIREDAFFVSEVMDELFSGMSSRLFERVREKLALAYYVRSSRVIGTDASMFYFYAGTEPGKEAAVLREIQAEIARVARGAVTSAELARCKTRLKAGHRMGLQTNSQRALQAALNTLYDRPADDTEDYAQRIDSVTRAELSAFAKKYLRPTQRLQLTLSP
ncbi:peptidase M16 [Cephaloticoccus primus]|uniref:Peptidase M16 n=1 Tax=Cephaloticoccus primus TaxID=1548207 RepID=A0A139SKP6_9BACT|nr:pitrilysin family protein [Cephaloticoccus primus]KXU35064.1 peptidase M16 [Cephaloticoccus primus]